MARADLVHAAADGGLREIGPITIAAQVREIEVRKVRADDLLGNFGSGIIRKVAMAAEDTLLDAPRPARVVLEQFQIMIGLQKKHIASANALNDEFCGVTKVRKKADITRSRVNQKADWVSGIVRNAEGLDFHVANGKCGAGFENTKLQRRFELRLDGFAREPIAIDGHLKFRGENRKAIDMIGMFVRDENAREIFRCAADR